MPASAGASGARCGRAELASAIGRRRRELTSNTLQPLGFMPQARPNAAPRRVYHEYNRRPRARPIDRIHPDTVAAAAGPRADADRRPSAQQGLPDLPGRPRTGQGAQPAGGNSSHGYARKRHALRAWRSGRWIHAGARMPSRMVQHERDEPWVRQAALGAYIMGDVSAPAVARIVLRLNHPTDAAIAVLRWGRHAEVPAPASLGRKLREELASALGR